MKIFLDDLRTTPKGWIGVKWPSEVIEYLKTNQVEELSLDHDLGDDNKGTGYDVILWIEKEVYLNNFIPPIIYIHTSNSSARIKMEKGIEKINQLQSLKERK